MASLLFLCRFPDLRECVRNSGVNVCNSGVNVCNSGVNVCNSGGMSATVGEMSATVRGNVCNSGEIEYALRNLRLEIAIHTSAQITSADMYCLIVVLLHEDMTATGK